MLCDYVIHELCQFFGANSSPILSAHLTPYNATGPAITPPIESFKSVTSEPPSPPSKPIVLVGMMGAGKTSVGRKLAEFYGTTFIDADDEIVDAAGCSIEDIFTVYGETAFRDVEERVITRILGEAPCVLATGGGAFMNDKVRAQIKEAAISIWLKAELGVLIQRTSRRNDRPLLRTGNPAEILRKLSTERNPVYATADIIVETSNESLTETLNKIITSLSEQTLADDGAH